MKFVLMLLFAASALCGCATYSVGRDDLCKEMAAFANSSEPGSEHSVSLETSWGPSKNHPDASWSTDCHDGGYPPGHQLCGYLVRNTAQEFSVMNFRRAFACLSLVPMKTKNYVSYERLDAQVSAFGAYGVREDVRVTVAFKPNTENGTMQLDIDARAFEREPPK